MLKTTDVYNLGGYLDIRSHDGAKLKRGTPVIRVMFTFPIIWYARGRRVTRGIPTKKMSNLLCIYFSEKPKTHNQILLAICVLNYLYKFDLIKALIEFIPHFIDELIYRRPLKYSTKYLFIHFVTNIVVI